MTFMSWDNEFEKGLRAIALCDSTGYFVAAINCVRDGDMGKKDKNGVYERIWYGDYIENDRNENLRPATIDEVNLYMSYIPVEEAIGNSDFYNLKNKFIKQSIGKYVSYVIIETTPHNWYRKLWNNILTWLQTSFPIHG